MTAEQAVRFLHALGLHSTQEKPGWVTGSCPLAPWTHKHGQDRLPSFGLSVSDERKASFHCFACRSGSAEELLHSLELYAGPAGPSASNLIGANHGFDFKLAHGILNEEKLDIVTLSEFKEFHHAGEVFEPWPEWWLGSFQKASLSSQALQYLDGRGIDADTADKFDLRWDSGREMILAPYRNVYGTLAGGRGRAIHPDALRHYDYSWQGSNNSKLVWYNEPALDLPGTVIVVEGQFDCMAVAHGWPKVVANLTAKPTPEKLLKLADAGRVVQIPDNDETGEESVKVYRSMAAKVGFQHCELRLPSSVKDPGECHPAFLREYIRRNMILLEGSFCN